jgi:hypothetical protein
MKEQREVRTKVRGITVVWLNEKRIERRTDSRKSSESHRRRGKRGGEDSEKMHVVVGRGEGRKRRGWKRTRGESRL